MPKTSNGEAVVCPYCGEQHGDAWEWAQDENGDRMECQECKRIFFYWADFDITYHACDIEGGAALKAVLNEK